MSGGTVKAKCLGCLYTKDTHKVSGKLYPPNGGHLCEDCLIPSALEAQRAWAESEEQRKIDEAEAARQKQPHITCPECQMKSYNPNDIKQGYCGNCHWWTSDPIMRHVPKAERG